MFRLFIQFSFIFLVTASCSGLSNRHPSTVFKGKELDYLSLIRKGRDSFDRRRIEEAQFFFHSAINLFPRVAVAYSEQGLVLLRLGRSSEALLYLFSADDLSPGEASTIFAISKSLYDLQEFSAAENRLQRLLSIVDNPNSRGLAARKTVSNLDIYKSLSTVYYSLGKLDESICSSIAAVNSSGREISEVGEHIRVLISAGKFYKAFDLQKKLVIERGRELPDDLMIDYAYNAFYLDKQKLSYNIATTVLQRLNISERTFGESVIIRELASGKLDKQSRLKIDLCKLPPIKLKSYFPKDLASKVNDHFQTHCSVNMSEGFLEKTEV